MTGTAPPSSLQSVVSKDAGDVAYDPLKAPGPGRGLDHPESYWTATAGPAPADDGPLRGDREAEVVIIGGGYTGLACAAYLAREHGVKPVVLEANRPGWGCSGRNGSFVQPAIGRLGYRQWIERWGVDGARAMFAEAHAALGTVRGLIRSGSIDCDTQPDGWLKIAHRPSRLKELEEEHRLLEEVFAYPTELLDQRALETHHFKGAEAFGALRSPDSFAMHPLKLAYGVLGMARQAGAVVHGGSPVTGWTKDGSRHVLETPGGRIRANRVVVATNGYTAERLHGALGGRLLPVLSNIIVTRPMTPEEKAACHLVSTDVMTDTRNLLYYFRRLPDDRVLLGGRGPIGERPSAMRAHRRHLLAALKAKFPPLENITVDYFWGGWVAIAYDWIPHIHHAEDDPTVLYALGYGGSGVSFSLHAGRKLAERVAGHAGPNMVAPVDTPLPRFPLAPFRRLGQRAMVLWYHYRDSRD